VSLRVASERDLAFHSKLASHETVAPFLMPGAGELERLTRLLELRVRDGRPYGLFVIELDGDPVGALALEPFSERSRICQLTGLMVDPRVRRAGIALEAVRLACRRALVEYGQHRVQAETYGDNVAGQRLFERAGFTLEGARRQAYWRRDQWLDGVLYGVLAEELAGEQPH
jgi:RimJ/RimL family protein N-acetyltransferase